LKAYHERKLTYIYDIRSALENLTPRGVDVAGQPHEKHEQPVVVCAVNLLLDGNTPLNGSRFCRCKEPCRFSDFFFGDPGDLFDLVNGYSLPF